MKIVFMGTPQAAVPSLERLINDGHHVIAVYTQPDRPSGRGKKITFSPVKDFALSNQLEIHQPTKIKTPEALETFRSHDADVAVVVAYGRILPDTFLNAFPGGAINVHFSLLPKYRGAAPVNWAIVNGETETGVTTMEMDAGLDTGAILLQKATAIDDTETAVGLMTRLSRSGADLLSETLADIESIVPEPQDHGLATLAPIMKREDGIIDWGLSAKDIFNRVRGFQPFPTAFTYLQQAKLTIWNALAADQTVIVGSPGQIVEAHGGDLLVQCGHDSTLKLIEIQPEGKRRMPARDFINGFRPETGTVLGA